MKFNRYWERFIIVRFLNNHRLKLPKITLTYDDDLMTWLWEKIRYSLRSGRLGIRIRKLLQVDNSDHLNQFSDNVRCQKSI